VLLFVIKPLGGTLQVVERMVELVEIEAHRCEDRISQPSYSATQGNEEGKGPRYTQTLKLKVCLVLDGVAEVAPFQNGFITIASS
jgi:hypothetical protein